MSFYLRYLKRPFDLTLVIPSILISFPLFLAIIIIFLLRKENPFFLQKRPGKNGKIFTLYKFRTMRDAKPNENIHDLNRVTTWGKFLRKTSLDELPQLFNVLIGDMSFVGPRPLLIEYLSLYNETQKKRLLVKPGITGWAQIHGRNALTWKKKFELDVFYVENASFCLDLYILLKTPFAIQGTEPSEPFNGDN